MEGAVDEYVRLVEVSRHYVTLQYPSPESLDAVERRLQQDRRFAYASIDRAGHFSIAPTDTFFAYTGGPGAPNYLLDNYQWWAQQWVAGLPDAWSRNPGWARVGIMDGGFSLTYDFNNIALTTYEVLHPDIKRVVATNRTWNFHNAQLEPNQFFYPEHGTHVLGLVAANPNNSTVGSTAPVTKGGVGACWNCSVAYAQTFPNEPQLTAAAIWLTDQGSQVINLSAGFTLSEKFPLGTKCSNPITPSDSPFCAALGYMNFRDVVFVAAAGNDRRPQINWPASEPLAFGIGGIDARLHLWDEAEPGNPWAPELYDRNDGGYFTKCPSLYPVPNECGSNYSTDNEQMDFVSPARKVISTVPEGHTSIYPFSDFYFHDENFANTIDGYGYSTGTSMAAPIFSGIVGLLRSANPLVRTTELYSTLADTASNGGNYNNDGITGANRLAWGIPNASNAIDRVHGKIAASIVKNRLTPMFVALNFANSDLLYSTRPQTILGAHWGNYLAYPDGSLGSSYTSSTIALGIEGGQGAVGYPNFPGIKSFPHQEYKPIPRSAFWVFTSANTLWNNQPSIMIPLYTMSFRESCDLKRHAYLISQAEIAIYDQLNQCGPSNEINTYKYDGIEGYIMNACPSGFSCDDLGDPSEPQILYRLYNPAEGRSALLTESQISTLSFPGYTLPQPGLNLTQLGYVFPNEDTDGDGLPDGMERMYGLDWFSQDSDCDGLLDGDEFPVAGVQQVGLDPLFGGSCQ